MLSEPWRTRERGFTTDPFILDKFLIVLGMLYRDAHLVHRYVDHDGDDAEVDYREKVVPYLLTSKMMFENIIPDLIFAMGEAGKALEFTPQALDSGNGQQSVVLRGMFTLLAVIHHVDPLLYLAPTLYPAGCSACISEPFHQFHNILLGRHAST